MNSKVFFVAINEWQLPRQTNVWFSEVD